jgi:hypothetical protein
MPGAVAVFPTELVSIGREREDIDSPPLPREPPFTSRVGIAAFSVFGPASQRVG